MNKQQKDKREAEGQVAKGALYMSCQCVPEGKKARCVHVSEHDALLQTARDTRWDHCARCLLLIPTDNNTKFTVDLAALAEEMEPHTQKVVASYHSNGTFPCGDVAKCLQHTLTIERDAAIKFEELITTAESTYDALSKAFCGLSPRDLSVVHRWATAPDPEKTQSPIRLKILAREFQCSERHIKRILANARELNRTLYYKFDHIRNMRAKITHAAPTF